MKLIRLPRSRERISFIRLVRALVGLLAIAIGVIELIRTQYLGGGVSLALGLFLALTAISSSWWRVDWGDGKRE